MSHAVLLPTLIVIYGLIIAGLVWIARRLGVARSSAICSSFFVFGLATGIMAAILWPLDSSVYPNILASWVGDWIYAQAILAIGDPHSDQAHYTIPLVLRIPQVYVISSAALCGLLGLVIQWVYNRRPGHENKRPRSPLAPTEKLLGG